MFTIRFAASAGALRRIVVERLVAAFALALLTVASAQAAERIGRVDRVAIEKVIRDQLDAFTRDDAGRAFAHASPEIRRMFGTSDEFIRMVRDSYQPVYRSSSVRFMKLQRIDDRWVQGVQLVDDEGRVWHALFTMQRQPDKSWKVGGCRLVQTDAVAT